MPLGSRELGSRDLSEGGKEGKEGSGKGGPGSRRRLQKLERLITRLELGEWAPAPSLRALPVAAGGSGKGGRSVGPGGGVGSRGTPSEPVMSEGGEEEGGGEEGEAEALELEPFRTQYLLQQGAGRGGGGRPCCGGGCCAALSCAVRCLRRRGPATAAVAAQLVGGDSAGGRPQGEGRGRRPGPCAVRTCHTPCQTRHVKPVPPHPLALQAPWAPQLQAQFSARLQAPPPGAGSSAGPGAAAPPGAAPSLTLNPLALMPSGSLPAHGPASPGLSPAGAAPAQPTEPPTEPPAEGGAEGGAGSEAAAQLGTGPEPCSGACGERPGGRKRRQGEGEAGGRLRPALTVVMICLCACVRVCVCACARVAQESPSRRRVVLGPMWRRPVAAPPPLWPPSRPSGRAPSPRPRPRRQRLRLRKAGPRVAEALGRPPWRCPPPPRCS
jgi:hypothetical protein